MESESLCPTLGFRPKAEPRLVPLSRTPAFPPEGVLGWDTSVSMGGASGEDMMQTIGVSFNILANGVETASGQRRV
jgi:hypothetical protein